MMICNKIYLSIYIFLISFIKLYSDTIPNENILPKKKKKEHSSYFNLLDYKKGNFQMSTFAISSYSQIGLGIGVQSLITIKHKDKLNRPTLLIPSISFTTQKQLDIDIRTETYFSEHISFIANIRHYGYENYFYGINAKQSSNYTKYLK